MREGEGSHRKLIIGCSLVREWVGVGRRVLAWAGVGKVTSLAHKWSMIRKSGQV